MTLFALLLTLLSAVAWTSFDFSRKKLAAQFDPIRLTAVLMLGQVPIFAVWFLLSDGGWEISQQYWWPAAASLLLNAVAHVLFVFSMKWAPISESIPLLSLSPAIAGLGGYLLLGEEIQMAEAGGILLILVGTVMITGLHFRWGDERSRGLLCMVGVAILWAFAPVFDKMAFAHAAASFHALLQTLGIFLLLQVIGRGVDRPTLSRLKMTKWVFILSIFAASLALASQFSALHYVSVGIFEATKRGVGMSLAVVFGALLFSEAITRRKVLSVGLISVGVFVLIG